MCILIGPNTQLNDRISSLPVYSRFYIISIFDCTKRFSKISEGVSRATFQLWLIGYDTIYRVKSPIYTLESVNWKIKAQLLSLSPTHFVNNIRLQHRCRFFKVFIIVACRTTVAVSDPEKYWNYFVAFLWFMSDHSISVTWSEIMFLTESKRFKVLVLVMRANLKNVSSLGFSFWHQVWDLGLKCEKFPYYLEKYILSLRKGMPGNTAKTSKTAQGPLQERSTAS